MFEQRHRAVEQGDYLSKCSAWETAPLVGCNSLSSAFREVKGGDASRLLEGGLTFRFQEALHLLAHSRISLRPVHEVFGCVNGGPQY